MARVGVARRAARGAVAAVQLRGPGRRARGDGRAPARGAGRCCAVGAVRAVRRDGPERAVRGAAEAGVRHQPQAADQACRGGAGTRAPARPRPARAQPEGDGRRDEGGRGRVHPLHRGRLRGRRDRGRRDAQRGRARPHGRRLHHARAPVLARRRPERAGDPVRAGLDLQDGLPDARQRRADAARRGRPARDGRAPCAGRHHTHESEGDRPHVQADGPHDAGDRLPHRVPARRRGVQPDRRRDPRGRTAWRRAGRDRVRALGVRRSAPDAQDVRGERRRSSARTSTGSSTSRSPTITWRSAPTSTATSSRRFTVSSTRGG